MASQGPNYGPISQSGFGTAWSLGADNTCTWGPFEIDGESANLDELNVGFSIPGGATIDGIIVEIEKFASASSVDEVTVQLYKAGVAAGDNKAELLVPWPGSAAYTTYGSSSDLWGTTWTVSQINATDFGVYLRAVQRAGGETAHVTTMRMTVHYTSGGVAGSQTLTLMGVG